MTNQWKVVGDKLNSDLSAAVKKARKRLEDQIGTIYLLDNREIKLTAFSLFSKGISLVQVLKPGVTATQAAATTEKKLIELTIEYATAAEKNIIPILKNRKIKGAGIIGAAENRYDHVRNLIDQFIAEGKLDVSTSRPFIVRDHTTIQKFQREIVGRLRDWLLEESNLITAGPAGQAKVQQTLYNAEGAQKIIQGGHGAQIGVAVSQIAAESFLKSKGYAGLESGDFRVSESISFEETRKELNAAFENSIDPRLRQSGRPLSSLLKQKDIEAINLEGVHNHFTTSDGKFSENFITIVSFQSSGNNAADSKREQALLKYLRDWITANFIATYDPTKEYSPSLVNRVLSVLTYGVSKGLKKSRIKGIKPAKIIKGENGWKNVLQDSVNNSLLAEGFPRLNVEVKAKSRQKKPTTGPTGVTPLQLLAFINSKLPTTIMANMGFPALNNRTGRFASGVKAIDVRATSGGFPSVGYTYHKDPYQVFELGVGRKPWATPDRDPRKLIDKSIREIAAELVISKLYTRRL